MKKTKKILTKPESINSLFTPVNNNFLELEKINTKQYKYWKSVFAMLMKSKTFLICFIIFILILLTSLIVPSFYKDPQILNPDGGFVKVPDSKHWFGLDWNGNDFWIQIWWGMRTTFLFLLILAAVEIIMGLIIGSIWGFFTKLDLLFVNLINFVSIVPSTIIIIIVTIVIGRGFWPITFSVLITAWIGMSTVVRNNINYVKNTDYNIASITLGTPWYKILSNNIIPHIVPVLVQSISFIIPSTIAVDMSVSFLGFDFVDGKKNTSIGYIISSVIRESKGIYLVSPNEYLIYIPLAVVLILSCCGYLMAKEFADIANPKNHR